MKPDNATSCVAGMTLREWFAGMAMQSLIAKIPLHDRQGEYGVHTPALEDIHKVREDVAESACDYADALLAELSKEAANAN